jgi:hypothetical protein
MTTQDISIGPREVADERPAFFAVEGDNYVPSALARGPWGQSVSGHIVGGLLGRAVEQETDDPALQPARLTIDLLRPTALEPVQTRAWIVREGRRIRLVDAEMVQNGTVVARASAMFLRRSEQPAGDVWSAPITMPPLPADVADVPPNLPMYLHAYGKNPEVGAPGIGVDEWQQASGPKYVWLRYVRPLVEGETMTPFVHAAMAGDVTSALTHWGTGGLRFINADYTLTLSRLPEGPFIGLSSLTHYSHAGVATGVASIFDQHGPIGSGLAIALVNPADSFRPPFHGGRSEEAPSADNR